MLETLVQRNHEGHVLLRNGKRRLVATPADSGVRGHRGRVLDEAAVRKVVAAVGPVEGRGRGSEAEGDRRRRHHVGLLDPLRLTSIVIDVMQPLVGRLPHDGPDPEGEVRGHEVHETETRKEAETLDDHLRVDEEEVHLEEGEERLEDRMGDEDVLDAPSLHRRVHRDLQAGEDQRAQAEDCKRNIS